MNLTAAQIGFIKALGVMVVATIASFLANQANLTGVLNPVLASLVAALAASMESYLKDKSGNNKALFGAVTVR